MAVKAKAQITLSYIIDVKAYYRYYKLQSSTSAKPSVPTAFPPSGWTDAEPSYTSGSTNSLYFVDCTVFCDDSFKYSSVSLSTSYEAAKEAYNKANNAQNSVDNMEIGGRNLLIGSSNAHGWTEYTTFNSETHEFTKSNTTTSEQFINCQNLFNLEADQQYTLSFKAMHNGYVNGLDVYVLPKTFSTTGIAMQRMIRDLSTSYKEYVFTFDPSANANNLENCSLRFDNNGTTTSGKEAILYVKDVKLEKGNRATDWSPAPDDMASVGRVDEMNNTLTDVSGKLDDVADATQNNKESLDSAWEIVEENKKQIADLIQENGTFTMNFTTLSTTVSELNGAYKTDYDERIKYIKFVDGEIWLGKEKESDTENDFKVVISNTKISFLQNGSEVAYISNNKLYISEAHITKSLRIGHFETVVRANGNVGTYWVDD